MNPHYQQKRNIRQSCCHKFYPQPFLIPVFNFSHKRPTFAFTPESGYTHSALLKESHTAAYTAKQGLFRMGVVSLPSIRVARSRTSPGRVSERQTLPLLDLGRGRSRRTQKAFGTAMRSCASLFRGVAAPLDCVICLQLGDVAVFSLCAQHFLNMRGGGWYHYPRCALRVVETLDGRLSKRLICRFLGLTGSSLIPAAQNTDLFGHGIPTEKRLNRQRLIPPPAGRCGSNTAVSRSPGLSRGPRCPAPARTPQVSAPAL